jgi:hypothetical protein
MFRVEWTGVFQTPAAGRHKDFSQSLHSVCMNFRGYGSGIADCGSIPFGELLFA